MLHTYTTWLLSLLYVPIIRLARQWALPILLSTLSLDHIMLILGLLLTEMRLVLVCPQPDRLTAAALGLVLLLRPLRWTACNLVIGTVPDSIADDIVDAPTPLVVGLAQLPPTGKLDAGPPQPVSVLCTWLECVHPQVYHDL